MLDKLKQYFGESGKERHPELAKAKAVEHASRIKEIDILTQNVLSAFTGQHPKETSFKIQSQKSKAR